MMIKSINTFITASTMFAELANLHKNKTASGDLEMMFPFWGLVCRRPGNIGNPQHEEWGKACYNPIAADKLNLVYNSIRGFIPIVTFLGSTSVKIYNPTVTQRKKNKQMNLSKILVPRRCTKCRREDPLQIAAVVVKDLHLCGNLLSQDTHKRNLQLLNTNLNHAYPVFLHY